MYDYYKTDDFAHPTFAHSNEPHPLLTECHDKEEVLDIIAFSNIGQSSTSNSVLDQTAGIKNANQSNYEDDDIHLDVWFFELSDGVKIFILDPLMPSMPAETVEHLESQLPSGLRAWQLSDTYYNCFDWICPCIPRNIFVDQILTPVYSFAPSSLRAQLKTGLMYAELGIIFMIFSMESLLEYSLHGNKQKIIPLPNTRAALAMEESTVDELNLASIHCTGLLESPTSPQRTWSLISSAFSQAIRVGFHSFDDIRQDIILICLVWIGLCVLNLLVNPSVLLKMLLDHKPEIWKYHPSLAEERRVHDSTQIRSIATNDTNVL
ncbi:hypothetical protein M422DRAFT_44446 [Sphaerobolus stellatus SS14]|nr:hypothetical protein M422DRAFT_44446 [Sphaerobolus stellatus SS14]